MFDKGVGEMSQLKKALEKAKEARAQGGENPFWEETSPSGNDQPALMGELERRDINPTYRSTKVVEIDPDFLRREKVISLCIDNQVADQIKILRAQILKMMAFKGNSLLVTSARPGEGKTLTAINLALSVCQELDRTVLLVDTDLKTPSVHRYFGFNGVPGLSDYLKARADVQDLLLNPGIPRLTILPAGKPVRNSSEVLGAPRMESLVKEMRERYPERFIIFDGSSLLSYADPLVFSKFVDGVLLVVASEKTSRQDLKRSLELLEGRTIIGTVLNRYPN
jgi:protein-tyrosine kinase